MITVLLMHEDADLILLRNVHPNFVDNGRAGSGGFTPSAEHDYCLSVDFHTLSSPKESRDRHEKDFGLLSGGVFGLTVSEFEDHSVECRADPIVKNSAHALADFTKVQATSVSQVRKTGRKLAAIATQRGQLD